ncbi:hypothetical protein FHS40_008877 [Streptomyces spectabilis]|uniref:IS256 family transposase n=1 Tax=Streptomyces spectabilis TaxID=68270 RepID=A0A7W8B6J0_STRST|nr:hypothetical protein [Streptomyces spectabilis]
MLDVPYELVEHVSWLIYTRRRELHSPWRWLGCFKQVLLALAHLRKNETFAQAGAGFGVSEATAWRYVTETIEVLASCAPGLHEALTGLGEGDFVIVDGTLIPTDRITADEPYYSQKHKKHGMNVQVIARPDGTPLWFSRTLPGPTHDLAAARAHGIVQACLTRQILVLADRACQGAGATVRTPYYHHREQPEHYQEFNRDHARLRTPGERAFARLKSWRLLRQGVCTVSGGSSSRKYHLMTDVTVSAEAVEEVQPTGLQPDALDDQLIGQLVDRAKADGIKLTGEGGLLQQLTKKVLESALEGEIIDHLGHEKHEKAASGNTRNGNRAKTVITEVGPVEIEVPRDREGSFGPQIVKKRQRRPTGVDEMVLSLPARGLTHGEISAHLADVYGAEVSRTTISTITDKAIDGMNEWQNRPLESVYPVLFIDCVHVKLRDGKVANRPIYVALAVTVEGTREILGLWTGDGGEGATYWLQVLTEIKNRGTEDVCMAVCDGLKGLPHAIEAVWPQAITQTCVVHLIRPCVMQGLTDHFALCRPVGRGQPVGRSVLVGRGASDHREDPVAFAQGIGKSFQDDLACALTPRSSVGRCGKRLAPAVRGETALA